MVLRSRGKARRLTRRLLPLLPIVLFAGMLALMQWVAGMPVTWLWLKTIVVCLAAMAVVRFLPWDRWLFRLRRGSLLFQLTLFALFVRHFAVILLAEARRALTARSLAAPNQYGKGWFRSLACAVSSFFARSILRAERFYAGLWVRGIGE
ncbi:MAG: hypothetical protein IT159_10755 [Bryobacterales bacterium]|nr:hypothetical protein [Bryobacterales bacterium]